MYDTTSKYLNPRQ